LYVVGRNSNPRHVIICFLLGWKRSSKTAMGGGRATPCCASNEPARSAWAHSATPKLTSTLDGHSLDQQLICEAQYKKEFLFLYSSRFTFYICLLLFSYCIKRCFVFLRKVMTLRNAYTFWKSSYQALIVYRRRTAHRQFLNYSV
jgi:hypothetical protein